MTVAYKERPITRLLQVTVDRESYILLGKLIQKRVEQDTAPSKATKSMVVAEAIQRLAIYEKLIKEPEPEKPKEIKTKPFEIVPSPSYP
jgi:hypothetical protein